MLEDLTRYLDSVVARDPSPRSRWEVLLYPGVWALGLHRVAHPGVLRLGRGDRNGRCNLGLFTGMFTGMFFAPSRFGYGGGSLFG